MAPEDVTSLLSAQAGRATSTIAIPGATTLDDTADDERLALFGCDSHGEHFGIGRDKVGRRESVDELARIEIDLQSELSKASILPRRDSSLLSGLGSRRRSKLARSPSAKSSKGTVQFRNAQTGEYGNLTTKGIIEVVHMVCLMRGSIARLLITTEAMVAEIPKKEPETPSMPGGGMEY